jgi:hypothetical protein
MMFLTQELENINPLVDFFFNAHRPGPEVFLGYSSVFQRISTCDFLNTAFGKGGYTGMMSTCTCFGEKQQK